MLPQHRKVPNFSLRIKGSFLLLLALVLITGVMLTLSFNFYADPGDLAAKTRVKLSLVITFLLSSFILLVGTGHWWHPQLWKRGSSQKRHRNRRGHSSRRHH